MLRVATVLSAREWESDLVTAARTTASVRLVRRAYRPEDLDGDDIDVVVAGAETSWITPTVVANWRRRGLVVVGVHPSGDRPAAALLEAGGADLVLADDTPSVQILQAVRASGWIEQKSAEGAIGRIVAVAAPPGGAGCSEVAIALAHSWSGAVKAILVDGDTAAPSLAVRLGQAARPDLTDAAAAVRAGSALSDGVSGRGLGFSIVVGSHRIGDPPIRSSVVEDVIEAARSDFDLVVTDLGTPADDAILKRADHAVAVVDASPLGLVRGARLLAEWSGPPPALVLNRVPAGERRDVVQAAREWTGLEPAAAIPFIRAALVRSRRALLPPRSFRRRLSALRVPT